MAKARSFSSNAAIGVVSTLIIIFCALLLTGSPPLYERHFSRKGWPVESQPGARVVEYGRWWLDGTIYGDGPWRNSLTSEGLCYVVVIDSQGARHKHLCKRVKTTFDRRTMTGTITFD